MSSVILLVCVKRCLYIHIHPDSGRDCIGDQFGFGVGEKKWDPRKGLQYVCVNRERKDGDEMVMKIEVTQSI